MSARVENDLFFAAPQAQTAERSVAEAVFYHGRPRPPPEVSIAVRAAATPLRFALVLFLVGWAGILFQAQFLQQVVIGAPVFEEFAKFGLALVVVTALRLRSPFLLMPLAWASGAAFGVMEHFVTYATEDDATYVLRVVFHAVSPGVSMLLYSAYVDLPDVRARWAVTAPATLFHWAFNFAGLVLGVGGAFLRLPTDAVSLAWGALVTLALVAITVWAIAARDAFERTARRALDTAMPRLGFVSETHGAPPRRS